MTPQERQMIDDLFDRLARVEGATRDPEAEAAIAQAWQRAPNASYALVQTVLVQDEALKRAHERIEALEARGAPEQKPAGGFLDPARDSMFGQGQGRGSVPNVPPPPAGNASLSRPAWNTGQVLGQGGPESYPPQQPPPQAAGGSGGSFLGTAAAAAAGAVGGSLLLNSIRSMMGGGQHGFGDASALGNKSGGSPWGSDQSGGTLARDAGVNDIGSGGRGSDADRAGQFDQAQADADQDQDQDQDDEDDFADDDDGYDGDDGDTDFA